MKRVPSMRPGTKSPISGEVRPQYPNGRLCNEVTVIQGKPLPLAVVRRVREGSRNHGRAFIALCSSSNIPKIFLFSISIIFTVLDRTQLGSLAHLGLYAPYLLMVAAAIALAMALGMLVGFAAQKKINDVVFRRGVLGVLSLAAISLLISSLRGLKLSRRGFDWDLPWSVLP